MLKVDALEIGKAKRAYIIAEMACAHNGKKEYALRLIDMAVKAKADAIQLQIFNVGEMIVPSHEAYGVVKSIEFSGNDWLEIINYARNFDIDLLVCAYDIKSLEFAIGLRVDGIKFNSADLLNIDMLECVARSKLPLLLHSGASSMEEIAMALEYIERFNPLQIILMHGVQNFPTPIEKANIGRVALLKENFRLPCGYDDHSDAESEFSKIIDLIAIGTGADVIEKHITLSRAEKGIDYQSALEENEFVDFVQRVHLASKALGSRRIESFDEGDLRYRKFQKKSITAIRDIAKGEVLQREDFKFLRNKSVGLAPIYTYNLIGRKILKDIKRYENILSEDLE